MWTLRLLLCVLALGLLDVSVDSAPSSSSSYNNYNYDLSGSALTRLYNSKVYLAERMRRPLEGRSSAVGVISHTGVRVTLGDGSQYLVHKGNGYGLSSDTVVTDARHMSSAWEVIAYKNFEGSKRVADFVRVGGPDYNLLWDNCHWASRRMMDQ